MDLREDMYAVTFLYKVKREELYREDVTVFREQVTHQLQKVLTLKNTQGPS